MPPEFCKFRTYGAQGAENDRAVIHGILQGRIRFARLASFNDPFEGRPHLVSGIENPGALRKVLLRFGIETARRKGLSPGAARKNAEALLTGKTPREFLDEAEERVYHHLTTEVLRVFCLSDPSTVSKPLPWSHYSDHHRGICIHFSTRYAPFKLAFDVRYRAEYPTLTLPYDVDTEEMLARCALTKCDQWAYEDEWRILRRVTSPEMVTPGEHLMVHWEGDTALFAPKAVTAVTFGARMPESEEKALKTWMKQNAPHVQPWKAQLHSDRFELTRHPA
jgi:hypothetical protein